MNKFTTTDGVPTTNNYDMSKLKQSDYTKISRFFNRNTLRNQNEKTPIVRIINDTEVHVGIYHIVKADDLWTVDYAGSMESFGTRKNAMYFAFLDHYGKHTQTNDLQKLDHRASNYKINIDRYHRLMRQTTDSWKYQLFCNKLSEEEARFIEVKSDLKKWFKLTKYMKLGI